MSIPHATAGEVINIAPFGNQLAQKKTFALFKSADLEVLRLVLQAGKSMPAHKVTHESTLLCLEGKLEITTDTPALITLLPQQLLLLPAGQVHSVMALEPSSALLTIVLP